MGRWEWPAYVGIIGGIGLFLAMFIPSVMVQYRRYGSLNVARMSGVAAVCIYGVALVAYTLLPLPPRTEAWCAAHGYESANLRPFQFLDDIANSTEGMSLRSTLFSAATLQVVFNVVLFIPFGVLARRFFGRGIVVATLAGLLTSIAIETTQYTGIWGIYPCSYRYGDVDDLIANTSGALIGACVAWIVLGWMPQSERLERHRLTPRPVTRARRLLGMSIDFFATLVLSVGPIAGMRFLRYALDENYRPPSSMTSTEFAAQAIVPAVVVFYGPALIRRGGSLGQRIVWLAPSWPNNATGLSTLWRRLVRATVPAGLVLVTSWADSAGVTGAGWWNLASFVLLFVGVVAVFVSPDGLSYRIAGGHVVDARSPLGAPRDPDEATARSATLPAPQ